MAIRSRRLIVALWFHSGGPALGGYYYGQDGRFHSTDYLTKPEGRAKPESGNDIVGARGTTFTAPAQ